jgi:hypothetical protein
VGQLSMPITTKGASLLHADSHEKTVKVSTPAGSKDAVTYVATDAYCDAAQVPYGWYIDFDSNRWPSARPASLLMAGTFFYIIQIYIFIYFDFT